MKDFLTVAQLETGGLRHVLRLTATVKRQPRRWRHLLADQIVVLHESTPSTTSRLSFEAATRRLGGVVSLFAPGQLSLDSASAVEDAARAFGRLAKVVVLSLSDHADIERLAAASTIPVVNAGSDLHHPCNAIADLFTLQEHFGHLAGLRVAYLGCADGIANSLLEACALGGVDIVIASPPGYGPAEASLELAERCASTHGSLVVTTLDPLAAAAGADAVFADAWVPAGGLESDQRARISALVPYRVDAATMAEASPDAVYLQHFPVHRGQEVAPGVVDSDRSLVWGQVENQLHAAQAVLMTALPSGYPYEPVRCRPSRAAARI